MFYCGLSYLVGKAHGQIIELYEDGGDFILDVMDAEQTKGTHWHPNDVEGAIGYITSIIPRADTIRTTIRRASVTPQATPT